MKKCLQPDAPSYCENAPCTDCPEYAAWAERVHRQEHSQDSQLPIENPTIFDKAKSIVYGDREKVYGDPSKNIRNIAAFWNTYLKAKYGNVIEIDMYDVCSMMRLLKEARLTNSPDHEDSLIDLCGYAGVQHRIKEK